MAVKKTGKTGIGRKVRTAGSLREERCERICSWLSWARRGEGKRLAETRRLFGRRVVIIDPHTHSNYSDGKGTVEENRLAADEAGLDFIFATDHHSLMQKRVLGKFKNMSWGQEPGAGPHHIGLLCNRRLFKPGLKNFSSDLRAAARLAPFTWVPHPAGWYPSTEYSGEQIEELWRAGEKFAVEVINGAHKIGSAFDRFDEAAVEAWDRLLCGGRRVTPLGASDAHVPESIGCAWTALTGASPGVSSIIRALNTGRCVASEASLLDLRAGNSTMGATVRLKKGETKTLRWRAADSAGIQCVRIVSGGRVRKTIWPAGAAVAEGAWKIRPRTPTYCRLESRASDNRRAFSAPIYLEPYD